MQRQATQGPRARTRRHDWIDERSRALALRVAEHARQDLTVFDRALDRVRRHRDDPRARRVAALAEWEYILTSEPHSTVLELLIEDSERGQRLRQSSPFVGILPREERDAIFAFFETL
jgi:hypothetical protein